MDGVWYTLDGASGAVRTERGLILIHCLCVACFDEVLLEVLAGRDHPSLGRLEGV